MGGASDRGFRGGRAPFDAVRRSAALRTVVGQLERWKLSGIIPGQLHTLSWPLEVQPAAARPRWEETSAQTALRSPARREGMRLP